MSEHERLPTSIPLDLSEMIDRNGSEIREITLINTVISMANVALREYDLEIVPSVNLKTDERS